MPLFDARESGLAAMQCATLLLLILTAIACGSNSQRKEPDRATDPELEIEHPLVGIWNAAGTHKRLGEVEIVMTLESDGSLRMVITLPSGGNLSFPGTWETNDRNLILRAAFFAPTEISKATWLVDGSGAVILTDANGTEQKWTAVQP